jgi:hypothetical protein
MNKADAVLELERCVPDAGRLLAFELLEYPSDVAFVLGRALGFDFVADHHPFHGCILKTVGDTAKTIQTSERMRFFLG